MQYRFKLKTETLDSQRRRRFQSEEINVLLNMAQMAVIKIIAAPRPGEFERTRLGFETQLRSIEDLRNIVVTDKTLGVEFKGNGIYQAKLPSDFLFLQNPSYASITNESCSKRAQIFYSQLDDRSEESPFDRSDFDWGEVNMQLIQNDGVRMIAKDFVIKSLILNYIRKPKKIIFAENAYKDIDGEDIPANTDQACELSEVVQDDIIDMAAFIASDARQSSDLQSKMQKINSIGL